MVCAEKKRRCKRGVFYASLFGVGAPEALVIGVVALLVFGPKGLAEVSFTRASAHTHTHIYIYINTHIQKLTYLCMWIIFGLTRLFVRYVYVYHEF